MNILRYSLNIYTFDHCNPHTVRIAFKCNVADKSIKTHIKCANLNVHRCKNKVGLVLKKRTFIFVLFLKGSMPNLFFCRVF